LLMSYPFESLAGAQAIEISSDPDCRDCSIELIPVRRLGTADDSALLSQYSRIAIDARGRVFAAPSHEPGKVLRYDSSGSFIGSFGGDGEGPGEYTSNWNMALFIVGDTVVIADPGNNRVTYASQTGEVHRIVPTPPASSYLPLSSGRIAFSRNVPTEDAFGYPLHIADSSGAVQSFTAEPDRRILPGEGMQLEWRLGAAPAPDDFWSYSWTEYKLAKWSAAGKRKPTQVLTGERAWLADDFRPGGRMAQYRWVTYLAAVREDSMRRLWILAHVVSEDWEEHLPTGNPGRVPTPEGFNRLRNTIVEVVDLQTGRLIVRDEIDPMVIGFVDEEHVYGLQEDAAGIISIVVWRMRIENE
jgi:hypothetical protein